jgi:hypothetical protein
MHHIINPLLHSQPSVDPCICIYKTTVSSQQQTITVLMTTKMTRYVRIRTIGDGGGARFHRRVWGKGVGNKCRAQVIAAEGVPLVREGSERSRHQGLTSPGRFARFCIPPFIRPNGEAQGGVYVSLLDPSHRFSILPVDVNS